MKNPHMTELLREAEQAIDSRTNGLMDRDEFPILMGKLVAVMEGLLVRNQQLEQECEALAAGLSNPPKCRLPQSPLLDSLMVQAAGSGH